MLWASRRRAGVTPAARLLGPAPAPAVVLGAVRASGGRSFSSPSSSRPLPLRPHLRVDLPPTKTRPGPLPPLSSLPFLPLFRPPSLPARYVTPVRGGGDWGAPGGEREVPVWAPDKLRSQPA